MSSSTTAQERAQQLAASRAWSQERRDRREEHDTKRGRVLAWLGAGALGLLLIAGARHAAGSLNDALGDQVTDIRQDSPNHGIEGQMTEPPQEATPGVAEIPADQAVPPVTESTPPGPVVPPRFNS